MQNFNLSNNDEACKDGLEILLKPKYYGVIEPWTLTATEKEKVDIAKLARIVECEPDPSTTILPRTQVAADISRYDAKEAVRATLHQWQPHRSGASLRGKDEIGEWHKAMRPPAMVSARHAPFNMSSEQQDAVLANPKGLFRPLKDTGKAMDQQQPDLHDRTLSAFARRNIKSLQPPRGNRFRTQQQVDDYFRLNYERLSTQGCARVLIPRAVRRLESWQILRASEAEKANVVKLLKSLEHAVSALPDYKIMSGALEGIDPWNRLFEDHRVHKYHKDLLNIRLYGGPGGPFPMQQPTQNERPWTAPGGQHSIGDVYNAMQWTLSRNRPKPPPMITAAEMAEAADRVRQRAERARKHLAGGLCFPWVAKEKKSQYQRSYVPLPHDQDVIYRRQPAERTHEAIAVGGLEATAMSAGAGGVYEDTATMLKACVSPLITSERLPEK
ncbi:unnamed protein product [Vitrella brassicaformis CCMP3155]|uniref:Uncharacterized protein n=1 Tax=Vitrella brassicaformis (strain CCMP3155) TaxID=1169540 RepID=A0A0G4EZA8_VITBC|nr:unnamed protein product [Vitrella brassicaformis CCMP3155]|eukprot:CEM04327.1 unnamed protein product [Vitrella brassicaformis CCMP3155]